MGAKILNMNQRQVPAYPEIEKIVRERKLGFSAACVLMNLKSRMNVKNRFVCRPTRKEIADNLGITERQVSRILKRLREAGLIKIEAARFVKGAYRYSFNRWWAENEEVKTT